MNSPWGQSQQTTKIIRGLNYISTAGHGGFMISKSIMKMFHPALKLASIYGGMFGSYTCFEEDVEFAAVMIEIIQKNLDLLPFYPLERNQNIDTFIERLKTFEIYHPYLKAKGLM